LSYDTADLVDRVGLARESLDGVSTPDRILAKQQQLT